MKKYYYIGQEFDTLESANAAVLEHKTKLETCPCEFIHVKEITGSSEAGWKIPSNKLTDEQILAIDPSSDKHYSVASVHHGDSKVGLTAAEAIAEIDRLMRKYGSWAKVDKITVNEETSTQTDMSAFVE